MGEQWSMPGLSHRRAVVTGAGGALGEEVVARLHAAGARVAGLYRRRRPALPAGVGGVGAELADEGAVAGAFAECARLLGGPPEVLVHCAGGYAGADLAETDLALWRQQLDANLTAAFLCLRAALPPMVAARRGRIVLVGSRSSLRGEEGVAAYSASKGGLLRLAESAAEEGLPHGVTVNCVLPGTIDTPQNRRERPSADPSAWVPPGDIATLCLFLCSDGAAAISGAAIPVYGRS